jgi:uncharacterized membrane protein
VGTAHSTFTSARTAVVVILLAALVIGLTMASYVTRLAVRPMRIDAGVQDRRADGDLTQSRR